MRITCHGTKSDLWQIEICCHECLCKFIVDKHDINCEGFINLDEKLIVEYSVNCPECYNYIHIMNDRFLDSIKSLLEAKAMVNAKSRGY